MKDVPSACEHMTPTRADVLAREKAGAARRLSVPEMLLLVALGGATGFYALQPPPPVFDAPAVAGEARPAEDGDEARPRW
ncbi:MAG TPA: hypothetical protein VKA39_07170 [Beijerinckiaceae bacterium]|nr:hypothetical protein [Beijerinckiaceae bacterium]